MICTQCSNHVRPIVCIDIDGTLGAYHRPFAEFAANYWNLPVPPIDWNGEGEFEDFIGISKPQYREAKLAYRQGGMKRIMPMYTGAVEMMDELYTMAEVWLTTTRPWNRLDSIDPDTQFWLARNKIKYHHLMYDDHKYLRMAQIVDPARIVAIYDDLVEQTAMASVQYGVNVPILRANSHNENLKPLPYPRLHMAKATQLIVERINKWNSLNNQ